MTRHEETFITLIALARDDGALRAQLLPILRLDDFNRTSLLNTLIGEMRLRGAPAHFLTAVSCLLDAQTARRALNALVDPSTRDD